MIINNFVGAGPRARPSLATIIPIQGAHREAPLRVLSYLLILFFLPLTVWAQDPPKPRPEQFVVDQAGIFSQSEETEISSLLNSIREKSSQAGFPVNILVITVADTGGEEASAMAPRLGQSWGVGMKKSDGGGVFLIAPNSRDYFFATGYGLEGHLPDAILSRLGREILVPNFRMQNYSSGVKIYLDALGQRLAQSLGFQWSSSPQGYRRELSTQPTEVGPLGAFFILAFIMAVVFMWAFKGRRGLGPVIYLGGYGRGTSFGGGRGFSGFGGGGFSNFGGGGFGGGGAGGRW